MSGFSLFRRAKAQPSPSAEAPPPFDHTADWAQAQVLPWAAALDLSRDAYARLLDQVNAERHDVFVFDIAGGEVVMRDKSVHHPTAFNRRIEQFRAGLYLGLLNGAVRAVDLRERFSVAVGVADKVIDAPPGLPVFGYQKREGERLILLPDIEFQEHHFYEREHADLHPDDKINQIVFSGASTGKWLSAEDVEQDRSERLRFAAHFHDHPQVKFTIGMAAECSTPEAEARLTAKPYFKTVTWHDQMKSRYIFSMDGNGATCSRILRGLRTRSVVLKLRSDYQLYYFSGLIPWRHFVPVRDLEDLGMLAPQLTRADFASHAIADAANAFCAAHLTREKVLLYTGRLLGEFHARIHDRLTA